MALIYGTNNYRNYLPPQNYAPQFIPNPTTPIPANTIAANYSRLPKYNPGLEAVYNRMMASPASTNIGGEIIKNLLGAYVGANLGQAKQGYLEAVQKKERQDRLADERTSWMNKLALEKEQKEGERQQAFKSLMSLSDPVMMDEYGQAIGSANAPAPYVDPNLPIPAYQKMLESQLLRRGDIQPEISYADLLKTHTPETVQKAIRSGDVSGLQPLQPKMDLPYKIGERHKFIQGNKSVEGTFQGVDDREPIFTNISEVPKETGTMKESTKEYLYGQTISQYDNDDTVKQFKRTQLAIPYINKADEIYKKTGNAGILQDALIYAHNKILDADSVVMVSEYLRSKGQSNLLDRVQGNVYKLFEGSVGLGPEQQKIMFDAVKFALGERGRIYDQRVKAYRSRASRYGVAKNEIDEMFPTMDILYGNVSKNVKSKFTILEVK